jgi:hypothetical protein
MRLRKTLVLDSNMEGGRVLIGGAGFLSASAFRAHEDETCIVSVSFFFSNIRTLVHNEVF